MKRDILKNNKEFLSFRNSLLNYGFKFKIPYEDIEEIANDSIIKAIENFIEDRGNFESFCKVIFKRRLINFQKSLEANYIMMLINDEDMFEGDDGYYYENIEKNRISKEFLESLKSSFTEEEREFFEILYQVCEQTDIKLIAEASRIIGVSNVKGWDIFRRIQRKAINIWNKKYYTFTDTIPFEKDDHQILSKLSIMPKNINEQVSDYGKPSERYEFTYSDFQFFNKSKLEKIFSEISDKDLKKLIGFYK